MSLRARILGLAVGSAVAVLLLLSVPVSLIVHRGAEQELEQDASTLVQGVADLVSTGSAQPADLAAVVERTNDRRNRTPVTVVLADGTVVGQTGQTCAAADGSGDSGGSEGVGGFDGGGRGDGDGRGDRDGGRSGGLEPVSPVSSDRVAGGEVVQVTAPERDGAVRICAFVPDADVRSTTVSRLAVLGATGLGVVAAVAVVALLVARRLARHLTATARTADRLGEGDLAARAPDAGPAEVRRVATALNRLAGRIDELLALERETVADLSHRLRTPLMAVRLDIEALPPSPARSELDDHVDQLERTLTAVIQAARRPQREGAAPRCDAEAVVRERFGYWEPLLEDQERPASLTLALDPGRGAVRAAREDLAATLDALLENAVAHTPEGTAVEVAVTSLDGGWVRIDVRDQGSGVPEVALQRGLSDRGSSGLGLDIARSCAEASGGRLELDRDGAWSVVRLVLGPAGATSVGSSTI